MARTQHADIVKVGTPRPMDRVRIAGLKSEHGQALGSTLAYVERHESVASLLDFGPGDYNSAERLHNTVLDPSSHDEPFKWFGVESGPEALRLIREGWADGAKRMEACVAGLHANAPACIKRKRIKADQGDEFDIHRAYSGGIDKAWSTSRRIKRGGVKSIRIALEAGANVKLVADKYFWRGAAALAITDALTEAGYSVELWTVAAAERATANDTAHQCAVKVKPADMPVDRECLAATLCLAGFHRTAIFARRATLPESVHATFGATVLPDMAAVGLGDAYVVPRMLIVDQASAQAWITKTIEAIEANGSF